MRPSSAMRLASLALALVAGACSTYPADNCYPPCGAADVSAFAACVASGDGTCLAGNRRCCALAQHCIGALDDQTVQAPSGVSCTIAAETSCWPACMSMNDILYDSCVSGGGSTCAPGDEECCALAQDCLGPLGSAGDVYVYADGCCVDDTDCDIGESCEPGMGMCFPVLLCGNEVIDEGESCDPPDGSLACDYGAASCTVCTSACTTIAGTTSFCGDDVVDDAHETCDPPNGTTCDTACQRILPATCRDTRLSPGETDIDCGGSECLACTDGQTCRVDTDCRVTTPECNSTIICEPAMGMCLVMHDCDDADACTTDSCQPGAGCAHLDIDVDMDGDPPESLGCGGDCNDSDMTSSSLNTVDLGCTTGEAGFAVDNDCDTLFDEDC